MRFTPLRFLHGKLPVLGFRIEAIDEHGRIAAEQPPPLPLAYCTDVSAVVPETWPKLRNLRTLVLDMLRYRKHPTHMTVDQALELLERCRSGSGPVDGAVAGGFVPGAPSGATLERGEPTAGLAGLQPGPSTK